MIINPVRRAVQVTVTIIAVLVLGVFLAPHARVADAISQPSQDIKIEVVGGSTVQFTGHSMSKEYITGSMLGASAFRRTYQVDISQAELVNSAGASITRAALESAQKVNVFGVLLSNKPFSVLARRVQVVSGTSVSNVSTPNSITSSLSIRPIDLTNPPTTPVATTTKDSTNAINLINDLLALRKDTKALGFSRNPIDKPKIILNLVKMQTKIIELFNAVQPFMTSFNTANAMAQIQPKFTEFNTIALWCSTPAAYVPFIRVSDSCTKGLETIGGRFNDALISLKDSLPLPPSSSPPPPPTDPTIDRTI